MKKKVIVGQVSPHIEACQLTYLDREAIHYEQAQAQHEAYITRLEGGGFEVQRIPVDTTSPDSVFVEDCAIVFDEVAVITPMGAEARRAEPATVAKSLQAYRTLAYMELPATLEGGDVLQMDRTIFVGLSSRTNRAGIEWLGTTLAPYGYTVVPVGVHGCLHLKTGITAVNDDTLIVNERWLDTTPFADYDLITVPESEPWAANVIRLPSESVLMPSTHPETADLLSQRRVSVTTTDISEFIKAEAGLTCMSLRFV